MRASVCPRKRGWMRREGGQHMRLTVERLTVGFMRLTGCIARTSFVPYSSTSEGRPNLRCAVEAFQGDMDSLPQAHAEVVGFVDSGGNGFALSTWVKDAAAQEAARHGGTHFIVNASATEVYAYQSTTYANGQARCTGQSCTGTTSSNTQVIPMRRNTASIAVFRVKWAEMHLLPEAMRPKWGVHYGTVTCH